MEEQVTTNLARITLAKEMIKKYTALIDVEGPRLHTTAMLRWYKTRLEELQAENRSLLFEEWVLS